MIARVYWVGNVLRQNCYSEYVMYICNKISSDINYNYDTTSVTVRIQFDELRTFQLSVGKGMVTIRWDIMRMRNEYKQMRIEKGPGKHLCLMIHGFLCFGY